MSWPAVESPQWSAFDVPVIEHYAMPDVAPELAAPATSMMIGWDASTAGWDDPEPSHAALPAPEAERLSTPEEINAFIEVAWETAPAVEPEAPQWLPATEVTETSNDGGSDER